ncbi:uncharacterized protein [Argopecten irradians]|uniref:uncharacterized protein n=1 Tax=Argopecten irradians TaxID=31199 RepID=UPI003719BCEF
MYGDFNINNDVVNGTETFMDSSDDDILSELDLEMHAMVEIVASDNDAEGIKKMFAELTQPEFEEQTPTSDLCPMPIATRSESLSTITTTTDEINDNNKRFKTTTEKERNDISESAQSNRTKQNTIWGMRIFQAWSMESNGMETDMNNVTSEQLNDLLSRFYCEARPKNVDKRTGTLPPQQAEVYHKNTLINIRGAINRRLTDLGRDIDLVKDKEFKPSNKILTGLLKQRMRDGSSRATKHKPIINESDLEKISTYMSTAHTSPVALRQCVWYYIAIHFVTRGLEFHKQLRVNSFNFLSDEHGTYALLNHETQQKNYQGGISNSDAPEKRMYSTGGPNCPVEMLQLLIRKTDPNATMLFNQFMKTAKSGDDIWFTNKPLAARTYSNFMSDICAAAQLSTKYTAHCLRATAIDALNNHGFEARHIMYMSGHKTESAIRSYNRSCTSEQRQALSKTLSSVACTASRPSNTRVDSSAPANTPSISSEDIPSNTEPNTVARPISDSHAASSDVIAQSQMSISNSASYLNSGLLTNGVFHGCTFNFGKQ